MATDLTADALRARLDVPVDAAGLGAFRLLFGLLMTAAVIRTAWLDWIEALYIDPVFHFTYPGFAWVQPLPGPWMYLVFAAMGTSALALGLGIHARPAAAAFFALFTYVELCDVAPYLNHHYLVSLLALLLAVLPSDAAFALRGTPRRVPLGAYTLLRAQIGLVYVFAGIAKLDADWLLRAEPLATWLQGYAHVPLIGAALAAPATAFVMSWGGALFDLLVPFFLLWRRTRPVAYAVLVGFHVAVGLLFPIGMFPWLMIACATVFFAPDWPRRVPGRMRVAATTPRTPALPVPRLAVVLGGLWLALQIALPLRHLAYPGDVNWTEQGFRFSWRVMLIEKTGMLEYRVVDAQGVETRVVPRDGLTELQRRQLATQPDLIAQYARHLAMQRGPGTRVYADAWASLNARPSQRLIDPDIDLAQAPVWPAPASYILAHPHDEDRP